MKPSELRVTPVAEENVEYFQGWYKKSRSSAALANVFGRNLEAVPNVIEWYGNI